MKELKKNIVSVAVQVIAQAVIYLILYRYILDEIGIEKIGVWSIILATTSVARVSEMGLSGSITKFIANYRSKQDYTLASESMQTACITITVSVSFILLLVYPLLQQGVIYFLPVQGINDGLDMLPYALVSLWITSIANVWMNSLDGCLRSDLRAILMVMGNIVLLSMSVLLVKSYGLIGLALAQMVQSLFLLLTGWVVIRRVMKTLPILPLYWKWSRLKEMLSYGINFQINSLVMLLLDPVVKILLGKFSDLATVGYFEMAQRLVTMTRNLIIQSNRVIVPVYASINNNETNRHNQLYKNNLKYSIFILTPLFAILSGSVSIISDVWLGEYQLKFVTIALYLSFAWYLNSITAPAYFAYLGQGKLFWVTTAHVTMGVINIFLGYFLGRVFGWHGVIFSFCVALVVGSFVPAWVYQKNINLSIKQIFSKHDVILIVVCFSAAISALIGYQLMLDVNIWLRTGVIIIWLLSIILYSVWIHPVRKDILVSLTPPS